MCAFDHEEEAANWVHRCHLPKAPEAPQVLCWNPYSAGYGAYFLATVEDEQAIPLVHSIARGTHYGGYNWYLGDIPEPTCFQRGAGLRAFLSIDP
jgi:hypothetical protein